MPPRGRPPKRGNTRTDAALDAMRLLGFPSDLVRRTLKNLLAEYGGDDGWVFIEETSYMLLIETLLQNSGDDGRLLLAAKDTETAESSCAVDVDAKRELTVTTHVSDVVLHDRNEATGSKRQIDNTTGAQDDNFQSVREEEEEEENKILAPKMMKFDFENIKLFELEDPEFCFTRKNGKPFYGWIDDDDEDFDPKDLVHMEPHPFMQLLMKSTRKPERRSRWDVQPQDM